LIALLVKCETAECGRLIEEWKLVARCCGTVGKMHSAENCCMWGMVCPQEGIVNWHLLVIHVINEF